MEQKKYWASYIIDSIKGTFGNRGSSHSESNHSSVKSLVIKNVDGIDGIMQKLMKHQKHLILRNKQEIAEQNMTFHVINQNYKALTNEMD